jgi:hypothetical protein
VEKFGRKGCILLGKKYQDQDVYKTELANPVFMDVSGAHVVSIFGKRGGGKSYTMGVIAEGFYLLEEEIRSKLSVILLDTMGIYWTMSHPNETDRQLLSEYGLLPRAVKSRIFTPLKYHLEYKKKGIPTDYPFSIRPSELDTDDWLITFRQKKHSAIGVLIEDAISELQNIKKNYSIDDIIEELKKNKDFDHEKKMEAVSMFQIASRWGVFSDVTTDFNFLGAPGEITVIDVSCYATEPDGWDIKTLVVGLVSKHLFLSRMLKRKQEEFDHLKESANFFHEGRSITLEKKDHKDMPLVWLVIDEAHEFLPRDEKDANAATEPLKIIMREGRQPGISLIAATQQPGKIHTDVMTQSDIVLSHRITASIDTEALSLLAQSYNRDGIISAMEELPREKGTAVVFDDLNEKIHKIRVRPRISWHGGGSPNALTM